MAKTINIVNGTGTSNLINDTYSVAAQVTGYNNASIDPSSVTVVEGTNTYAFTIAATGTLTLHVSDDGTSTGNPIVDLQEDLAAEEKARATYENLMDLTNDADLLAPLSFLRQREVVHYNRFNELLNEYKTKMK